MNNKIPPETEEKILKEALIRFYDKSYKKQLIPAFQKAISLSFQAGQKQEREDVLKEIELLRHLWNKGNCNNNEKECLNYACDKILSEMGDNSDLMECSNCRRVVKYNENGICRRCKGVQNE